jgi:hypothetical protein
MNCDHKIKYLADFYTLEIVQLHNIYNHSNILRNHLNLKTLDF